MSRKLLFLSVAIVGLLAFITFQNGEILFKEGKSVSSVNIVALAGDEFHHETWDDMELVNYHQGILKVVLMQMRNIVLQRVEIMEMVRQ